MSTFLRLVVQSIFDSLAFLFFYLYTLIALMSMVVVLTLDKNGGKEEYLNGDFGDKCEMDTALNNCPPIETGTLTNCEYSDFE